MARFAIQINSAPWTNQSGETAYQFINAALSMGHQIERVFFYYDGTYNALRWEREEPAPCGASRWSKLAASHGIDLVVCISAAQRRGVVSDQAVITEQTQNTTNSEGFRIGGLGLWIDACLKADRVLVFGG
jgi:tRNA 2-thiouridine synthesizing protein D